MASRRLGVTATTNDALANEDIRLVEVLSRVNFWSSSVTNGDQCGLRLNKTIIMDDGEVNTIAGDVIDSSMDSCSTPSWVRVSSRCPFRL
jgi:hypothetical protein